MIGRPLRCLGAMLVLATLAATGLPVHGQQSPKRGVYFYENYKCGTSRNYTNYCNEEVDRLIDRQSQELDRTKRQQIVWQIQRQLEADVARPMLAWRNEYFTQWPYVKNLVPHHSLYNYGRMQDVWLDR